MPQLVRRDEKPVSPLACWGSCYRGCIRGGCMAVQTKIYDRMALAALCGLHGTPKDYYTIDGASDACTLVLHDAGVFYRLRGAFFELDSSQQQALTGCLVLTRAGAPDGLWGTGGPLLPFPFTASQLWFFQRQTSAIVERIPQGDGFAQWLGEQPQDVQELALMLLADKAPDYAEQDAAFFEGFHGGDFDLHQWVGMRSVKPNEAARFLNGKNPIPSDDEKRKELDDAKAQMLARVFEDENERNPRVRALLDWLAVARSRGADYDEGAANFVEVNTHVENTPQAAASEQETTEAPPALTTGDIAFCFDGLRWSEKQWRKPLGDKPKWLHPSIVIPGQRGIRETRWNPVIIAGWLVRNGHVRAQSARARFQTRPQLIPWLEAWKTYEADYLDND